MVDMSSTEIVFWISLFGIDIGVPLMFPERFKFLIGAVLTGLSATGLMWSLGYRASISQHFGWRAALVFGCMGMGSAIFAGIARTRTIPSDFFDSAEQIQRRYVPYKEPDDREWRKIAFRYKRDDARATIWLIREIGLKPPAYVRDPQNVADIRKTVEFLYGLIEQTDRSRKMRFTGFAIFGLGMGLLAFFGFRSIVRLFGV